MIGTSFSVMEAMRFTPPMKISPAAIAKTAPTILVSQPKAPWKASPMELAWTMLPMKPKARMMEMEKKAARTLEKMLLPKPLEM